MFQTEHMVAVLQDLPEKREHVGLFRDFHKGHFSVAFPGSGYYS